VVGISAGLEISRSQCEIAHGPLEPGERLRRGERRVRRPPRRPLQDCDSVRVGANLLEGLEASVQTGFYALEARRLLLVRITQAIIPRPQAGLQVLLREGDVVSHGLDQVSNGGGLGEQDIIGLLTDAPQDGSHLRVVTMLVEEPSAVVDRHLDSLQPPQIFGMKLVRFALARGDLAHDLVEIGSIGRCERGRTGDSGPPEHGSGADLRRAHIASPH
jgi:hypothetical protein